MVPIRFSEIGIRMRSEATVCTLVLLISIWLLSATGQAQSTGAAPKPPPDPPASIQPYFVSSPIREKHEAFLKDVIKLLLSKGIFYNEPEGRLRGPFRYRDPETLSWLLQRTLGLGDRGVSHAELLRVMRQLIRFSPHPSHPYMLDSRISSLDPYALAGDWLVSTVGSNGALYSLAPVFVLLELDIVKRLGGMIGWDRQKCDGITSPGFAAANGMALTVALQAKYPELKEKGLPGLGNPRLVLFIVQGGRKEFEAAAIYQGLGINSIMEVNVDGPTGKMDLQHLRARIGAAKAKGWVPFMVIGSAGSRDLGFIDDLTGIAATCKELGIWFHVSLQSASPALFHPRLRLEKLAGIEQANSVSLSTGSLGTPYVTSFLLVQGTGLLETTFGTHAIYLFGKDDLYNTSYDTGDATSQGSRRMEVAKLWYMWKARGRAGMGSLVETMYKNVGAFQRLVRIRPGFRLVVPSSDVPSVSFYYVPKRWRKLDRNSPEFVEKVSRITQAVQQELRDQNLATVSTSNINPMRPPGTQPRYFSVSLSNTVLGPLDLVYILDLIQECAEFRSWGLNAGAEFVSMLEVPPPPPPDPAASKLSNPNSPLALRHLSLFQSTFKLFLDKGIFFHRADSPYEFRQPDILQGIMNFRVSRNGASDTELLEEFSRVIQYNPHRGHPYFMPHAIGGFDPYTLAADWVASAMSTPMESYADAPVFILMEQRVLADLRKVIYGSTAGDGVIVDGGSMANQFAIQAALHAKDPRVCRKGIRVSGKNGKKFVGYYSQDAHYSTLKGFILYNLGMDSLVTVESDARGRMIPEKLDEAIRATLAEGNIPFFVCITTGTTVYGAIDPVTPLVAICAKYKVWCHIDGMVGGVLAFSSTYRSRLQGLELADSFGMDLHKQTGSLYTVAILITRRSNVFRKPFGLDRDPEDEDSSNCKGADGGSLPIPHWQLDRRSNGFKAWFIWKAKGSQGLEDQVNYVMDMAAYAVAQLHRREPEGFRLVLPEFETISVCFYYIPTRIRGLEAQNVTAFNEELGHVSAQIENTLILQGVLSFVAQQRLPNSQPAFLKFVIMDSSLTKADMDYLLDAIAYWGEQLPAKQIQIPLQKSKRRDFHKLQNLLTQN